VERALDLVAFREEVVEGILEVAGTDAVDDVFEVDSE
jgi:hypothetical protein